MKYLKSVIFIIILLNFTLTCCDNNETTISSPFGPKIEKKEKISFDHTIKAEIKTPDTTGNNTPTIKLETPVHPEGRVLSLEICEMPVELLDTELKNGALPTRKFGEIEIFLTGFRQDEGVFELHATQKQILNLKKEIIKYQDNKRDLFSAILDEDIPELKALINAKIDLNVRTVDNITPLIAAIIIDQPEVVRMLIAANADVNARDHIGWTPLIHFASANGDPEIGEALIKANADINASGKHGTTALIMAAVKGNMDLVKILVQSGADVNAAANTPKERFTALYAAEQEGHKEIAEFLKKSGAK